MRADLSSRRTMPEQGTSAAIMARFPLAFRIGFWFCIVIAVAVVFRRVVALSTPPSASAPPQLAGLDNWFASHAALTYAHILCALIFVLVLPLLFWRRTRDSIVLQRTIYPLGAIVGLTAYAMSIYAVGGWIERAAVLFFNTFFLFSLTRAFVFSRNGDRTQQQRWLLRAIAILLGIATTRPVMGIFFATSALTHLTPQQFFGVAFWIGFSINTLAMELWLRTQGRRALAGSDTTTATQVSQQRRGSMNTQTQAATATPVGHKGPHPGMLAILYMVLFCAGLFPVTALYKMPYWPGPWESASTIVPYFQTQGARVVLCLFLQLGAMVCLALFTATVVSRLHFLGARAAGVYIALLGGFLVVADAFAGTMAGWAMVHPSVSPHDGVVIALYYLAYGLGGPGFSIPMGLLIAGVTITSAFMRVLPKWVIVFGLILAVAGELSWLHLILFPKLLFLIPLTRFPGFIWLIAVGFLLPKSRNARQQESLAR
jgi:Predicted membrane protein (DUF2306)